MIEKTTTDHAQAIADTVCALRSAIMQAIGVPAYHVDLEVTADRSRDFLAQGKSIVFQARAAEGHRRFPNAMARSPVARVRVSRSVAVASVRLPCTGSVSVRRSG